MEEKAEWQKRNGEDDEAEDEEDVDETGFKTVKDAVLFAIDVSPSMVTPPPASDVKGADRDAPVKAALQCAYQLMQQRIISNPNDMMGILLFGTEKSKMQGQEESRSGGLAYPHCYLVVDLDVPSAADVKALRSMLEDDEEGSDRILVPSTEPVAMSNMLFCANQIFTTKAPNFASRRLFIVTDNDNPHVHDKALRSSATVRAKDLYDLGVTLELFPISRAGHAFDRSKFYEDIIYSRSPTDPDAPAPLSLPNNPITSGEGITLLNALLSSVKSKAAPRRALFSNLPLEIGPGCRISVKGFILLKRQRPARSCFVWLGGEKAQIAKGVTTRTTNDDISKPVDAAEVRKAFKFGGSQVVFTPEETSSLRYFGDPIIRIVGFKPVAMLPVWASVKQSTFIYPSEEDYVGSTRVFSALHQKLLKADRMAVAWYVARKNAAPVIAALLPGPERVGEHGEQTTPPGLWIVPLPFADDIRQNPDTSLVRSPEALIDVMREIMTQLTLPKGRYHPEKYPNPALQWHYRILQAMALDEEIPQHPDDKTLPKYKQIHKRVGPLMADWHAELEKQWLLLEEANRANTKRSSSVRMLVSHDFIRTKAETGAVPSTVSDEDMHSHYEKEKINKLTLPLLKGWMESKALATHGKKAELVQRIEQWHARNYP
ncbi:MAG: ATP-dependent DNA helicase II subunit 1 [Phylliscum demangeonii]|nr:MAG: ATP-dependent DNA helicase II subunit 1 [Phylliscum demangeonii]